MSTWGDTLKAFAECKTKAEAERWFAKEVKAHAKEYGYTEDKSAQIIKESLGYAMGYYDEKEAKRQRKMLDLVHPVMGWIGRT